MLTQPISTASNPLFRLWQDFTLQLEGRVLLKLGKLHLPIEGFARGLDDEHNNLFNLGHLPRPNRQWDQSCFHF